MSAGTDVAGIYRVLAELNHDGRRAQFRHRAHTVDSARSMRSGGRWSTYRTGRRSCARKGRDWRTQPRDERGRFAAFEAAA